MGELTDRCPDGVWLVELAAWIYWKLYCRVRRLEASQARGEPVSDDAGELRSQLAEVGANGLIELLDAVV